MKDLTQINTEMFDIEYKNRLMCYLEIVFTNFSDHIQKINTTYDDMILEDKIRSNLSSVISQFDLVSFISNTLKELP